MQNTHEHPTGVRIPAETAAKARAMAGRIKITHQQMNLILMAVEHGFRENERGKNLQAALASVFGLYEVAQSEDATLAK